MAKNPAPATLTGGAGFEFENQVAAWFMIHMLGKRLPLDQEFGLCQSIDFQVKDSGWLLDDLLITGQAGSEPPKRLSISIKRDRQVTGKGFPSTFVKATWQEWLGTESSNFVHDQDLLGLVVGVLAGGVQQKWEDMLSVVLETPADRVVSRFSSPGYSNEEQRNIFRSFDYPISLGAAPENGDIVKAKLLKHIRLLYFDFRSPDSQKRAEAIQLCQDCLRSGDSAEASILWDAMVGIAGNLRSKGGSIDLNQLLQKLRMFSFREFPDYRSDWDTLAHVSQDALNHVKTVIGDNIEVPRVELLEQITAGLREFNLQIIIGESGTGKSALAKSIEESGHFDRTVWLSSDLFARGGIHAVSATLGLQHGLMDVLKSFGGDNGLLIIDALEKADLTTLQVITDLIRNLDLDSDTSRWSVLITTQARGWTSAEHLFQKTAINLTSEMLRVISFPSFKELLPLRNALPGLHILFQRRELQEFLSNLKILDWIAVAASQSDKSLSSLVGMSEIIDWVWKNWIRTGSARHARAGLLKHLGEQEAVSFSGGTPTGDLDTEQQRMLASLEDDNLLVIKKERVRFAHDLMGDWARLHILIGQTDSILPGKLREYSILPIWHHAIRLYGIKKLEQKSDSEEWHRLLQRLDDGSNAGAIAANLFLESISFAPDSLSFLEQTWPLLVADNGSLLIRLLNDFHHALSFPDPRTDMEANIWLASSMRIPNWPYWGPMLLVLHRHTEEVVKLAIFPATRLCQLWLSQVPQEFEDGTPFIWRREAADLAIAVAREVQTERAKGKYYYDDEDEIVYRALLSAAADIPDDVTTIALELAHREPLPAEIREVVEEQKKQEQKENLKAIEEGDVSPPPVSIADMLLGQVPDPWPDGPDSMVDESFRKACMNKADLRPLIEIRPEVAVELILALSINHPVPKGMGQGYGMNRYGTSHNTEPSIYFNGPFYVFLKTDATAALGLIIRLVNFATQRWYEQGMESINSEDRAEAHRFISVELFDGNLKKEFLGDVNVYKWYRGSFMDNTYVTSALMALEKWLFELVETDVDITPWIKEVLKSANSTAFLGVLISLGKKHPELFSSVLMPILSIWQLYDWDDQAVVSEEFQFFNTWAWARNGEWFFNLMQEWHAMPHRKYSLRQIVQYQFVNSESFRKTMSKYREYWRTKSSLSGFETRIDNIIEIFTFENYMDVQEEDGKWYKQLRMPDYLDEKTNLAHERSGYMMSILTFPKRCREALNKGQPLSSEELGSHWTLLTSIVDEYKEEYQSESDLASAVMGGCAMLMVLNLSWLKDDPAKIKWCNEQVERFMAVKDPNESLSSEVDIFDTRWEQFLGDIMVTLIVENPGNKKAREMLVRSICAYHYKTTEITCRTAFRKRLELGEDFGRILNLSNLWAGIRWVSGQLRQLEVELSKLKEWVDNTEKSFVDGSLDISAIPLAEIAMQSVGYIMEAEKIYRQKNGIPEPHQTIETADPPETILDHYHFGLDLRVLQASHYWLEMVDEVNDSAESIDQINYHKELLSLVIAYIQSATRNDRGEIRSFPSDFDHWVFDIISELIPRLSLEESQRSLWQPILDLDVATYSWIKSFLSSFFIHGYKKDENIDLFVDHWKRIIRYCLVAPHWQKTKSWRDQRHLIDLQMTLMGIDYLSDITGQPEFTQYITGILPLFEQWQARWLNNAQVARNFAHFLSKSSTINIRTRGLRWLAESTSTISDYQWNQESLSDSLISLLYLCWTEHRAEIDSDIDVRSSFLSLLSTLCSKQFPGALELRDQVIKAGMQSN